MFGIHVHCKMITTIKLINIHHLQNYHCNSQQILSVQTVFLTTVTMLCIRSPELIYPTSLNLCTN